MCDQFIKGKKIFNNDLKLIWKDQQNYLLKIDQTIMAWGNSELYSS